MKQFNFHFDYFFLVVFLFLSAVQIRPQEISLKPYGIESGIINYKYSGSETGTSILYFDKWGNRSAMNMDTKRNDQPRKGWVISLKEYQYIFDPSSPDNGIKMKNPLIETLQKMDNPDYDKAVEELYSKMGMNKSGTEKFMDRECIVYKNDNGKILTWNGILMLMDMNYGGVKTKQEVTSIDINIPVDDKYFEIPKDIKFSEMPMFGR
jgi:hypothetical protein